MKERKLDHGTASFLVRRPPVPGRRSRMSGLFVTLWTCLTCVSLNAAERPNIVFIMADDLGWADVEFHGGNVPTPNLHRLAREGLELRSHYVAPVCSPTRTGLLTGRYWSRFGITTPTNRQALPAETVTLARALRSAGYDTCLIGKWHLGSLPKWGPNHFGFDHSYGSLAGGVTPWSHRYKKGPYSSTWHRDEKLVEEGGHVTDLLTAEAIEWLKTRSDRPFFLYLPFTAVHLPIREPNEWLERVPVSIRGDVPRQYAACIMHLDDAVGRIMATLEQTGKRRKTLVIFTSDNGGSTAENNDTRYPNIGDDCPNGRLTGNNAPLRGQKGSLYEGGIRVPTMVSWPGVIEAGRTDSTPVHIVDWMPTFCRLAGADVDGIKLKWDGADLWPMLSGTASLPERTLYWSGPRDRSRAVRRGRWKLLIAYDKEEKERKVELFDLEADLEERNDRSAARPHDVARMRKLLQTAMAHDKDSVVRHP